MLTKKESTKNETKTTKTSKTPSSTAQSTKAAPTSKTAHRHTGDCCQSISQTTAQQIAKTLTQAQPSSITKYPSSSKNTRKTQLIIKYNVGYSNQLFIRGKGANLSWEKGIPLKNVKADEWVWEIEVPFTNCEFKILINDHIYENGDNHVLTTGSTLLYTPHFS